MTDYAEEQANELEALQSIYPDELTLISTNPLPWFTIKLNAEYEEYDEGESCYCMLQFTYKENYPDLAPEMEILDPENLDDMQLVGIMDLMKEQCEENLGMAMVFTVVAAVQDHLVTVMENTFKEKKAAIARKIKEEEEKERKRFEGTRVTIETFLAWKTKFDAEMAELKRQQGKANVINNKLSGLELFMENKALDDSDVKFLEEDGDAVAVDESLFDDLDDLDIEDDDS